jgi:hypothetical protein
MLSPKLGTETHGIALPGYRPDPRLTRQPGGAYHAAFGKSSDHDLQRMVNFLRNRDEIIVVDWHYQPAPAGEYPSIDYFRKIGFKDVWGAPWHNGRNIRQLARYAARRGCGGMIATAWHDAYHPESRLLLHFIIAASAAYFHNPAIEPPEAGPVAFDLKGANPRSRDDAKHTGMILRSEKHLSFTAAVPETILPGDGQLLITPANRRGEPFAAALAPAPENPRELRGVIELPKERKDLQYQVRFCYTDRKTGMVYLKNDFQGFVLTDRPPPASTAHSDPSVLLAGDFTAFATGRPPQSLLWLGGVCAGPLGWAPAKKPLPAATGAANALDLRRLDRVWFLPSDFFNQALCRGMRIHIEVKMLGEFAGDPFCALLTKGSFSTGFRILVGKDRTVLFQIARLDPKNPDRPAWLSTKAGALPLDRWTTLDFLYLPPVDKQSGEMEIRIDDQPAASTTLAGPMKPSSAVVGIGCEFRRPTSGPTGKFRPNFPGLIRRFEIHGK